MVNKISKGKKIVDRFINKAKAYRDKKGYRENLGYDSQPKVEDAICKLDLTYTEKCKIMDYFESECDKI